jgi:hypothetical protein
MNCWAGFGELCIVVVVVVVVIVLMVVAVGVVDDC